MTSAIKAHPFMAGAAVFGVGAGTYAGISTAKSTEGSINTRAEAGTSSAVGYGVAGLAVAGGGMTLMSSPGLNRVMGKVAGGTLRDLTGRAGSRTGSYGGKLAAELRTAGGWKNTITRMPVMAAGGAGIGALLGAKLNHDDPGRGAAVGAGVGAGGGLVASRAIRATQGWKKMWGVGKLGLLASAAVAVGVGANMMRPPQYETDQVASSGVRSRMEMIGATGDVVFGLHNRR
jgi:hypothetical protein